MIPISEGNLYIDHHSVVQTVLLVLKKLKASAQEEEIYYVSHITQNA